MVIIKAEKHLLETESSNLIQFYRQNPVIAANQLLRLDDAPLELAPIQQIFLMEWWSHKFSLLTAARGSGKTIISAVYAALQTLLYPSSTIGIFAPAFRQSKLIFKEFDNIYQNSPILQQSIDKPPTYGNDQCICTYKPIRQGMKPSEIRALPVGTDGGKIRGARFKRVILDEIVHLPETIFRSAIQPMMSTTVNPMKRVREVEALRKANSKVIPVSDNGYIGITSGYYQFNYWWQEIVKFNEAIKKGSSLYNLRFIPYWELPEGFYDEEVVKDAEVNSPRHMFATEWLADWISDSEGAFPMSLLESVRDPKVRPKFSKDSNVDKGKEFIFGVDSARESDSTAIAIFELGYPSKLVYLEEIEDKPFPYQAKMLFDLIERFKPIRIYMDEYGGGNVLRDHLEDPESVGLTKSSKVIQVDAALRNTGKPILQLCNFNSAFIEDSNNNAKTLLEQRAILLPDATHPIEATKKSVNGMKTIDLVQEMINQISSVVVTSTPTGRLHYDLPKKRGSIMSPNLNKKDLYTSFILACKCIYDLQWKPKVEKVMLNKGVIKEIDTTIDLTQENFNDRIVGRGSSTISSIDNKKKITGGGVILRRDVRRK